MLFSMYYIKDCVVRLDSLNKQITEKVDLSMYKPKLYAIGIDLMTNLEEAFFLLKLNNFSENKKQVLNLLGKAKKTNDVEKFKNYINSIKDLITQIDFDSYNSHMIRGASYYHLNSNESWNINRTSMLEICNSLEYKNKRINILDVRCNTGVNGAMLKNCFPTAKVYGIEADEDTCRTAKKNLDRAILGSIGGSKISNEAFDILFIKAKSVATADYSNGSILKDEKKILQDSIKFLMPNGILIYCIPYYRFHKDLCIYICKNFTNIQVRELALTDFTDLGLVVLTATKLETKLKDSEINRETYEMLRNIYNTDSLDNIAITPLEKICLPNIEKEVELFRGSALDFDEMDLLRENSNCFEEFWKEQIYSKQNEEKEPLLPFNIGQIGLILTSGCLDGVIDEKDGHYHVIKGRVIKGHKTTTDDNGDEIIEEELISNKVQIHLAMPNGEYKILS